VSRFHAEVLVDKRCKNVSKLLKEFDINEDTNDNSDSIGKECLTTKELCDRLLVYW
jgi:hypothetical protein